MVVMQKALVIRICTFLFFLTSLIGFSQPLSWMGKPKPYKWMIGASWFAVEDDGRGFCQPFDIQQSWNSKSYPTRFFVDRYFKHGLSAEFAVGYTTYSNGKLINDSLNYQGFFLSVDANCKYSFYTLFNQKWLDPYTSLGIGMTQRSAFSNAYTATVNVGIGANFWIYKGFGIQAQTNGKIGLASPFLHNSDYISYSLGIVYRFQESKPRNTFSQKHYKWTTKKTHYKDPKKRRG